MSRSQLDRLGDGERIEWLDILRGLSAFAIVLFHVRVPLWVGLRALREDAAYPWLDRILAWMTLPFPFFGTAVMLFFIVSGFAIHYPYAAAHEQFAWRPYAVRRLLRIYPPYLAAVLFTLIAEWIVLVLIGDPMTPADKIMATVAMAQNYTVPAGQMHGNPSLWSLPVETELYLVYPALLLCWQHAGTRAMLTAVGAVSLAAGAMVVAGHDWPMGNFAKYWIIWAAGAALAEAVRTRCVPPWRLYYGYIAACGLAAAIAARVAGVPFGIEHFIWGGLYFLLILWGLNRPAALALPRTLKRAVLFLGDISYSLYLVHYPLLLIAGAGWMSVSGSKPSNVLVPIVASLLPIPVAYVLWRYVERPSQAWGRDLSRRGSAVPAQPVVT